MSMLAFFYQEFDNFFEPIAFIAFTEHNITARQYNVQQLRQLRRHLAVTAISTYQFI